MEIGAVVCRMVGETQGIARGRGEALIITSSCQAAVSLQPKLMAWNNFQSLRGRLYGILFRGHISINLSTAAFPIHRGQRGVG